MLRQLFSLVPIVLFATLSAQATAPQLPAEVHPTVGRAITRSDEAMRKGDHQLGLILLEGTLYSSGVTVAVDESSLKGAKERVMRATERAVNAWHRHLGGDSPIRLLQTPDDAQVVIKLVASLDDEAPDALGFINLQKSYRWTKSRREVVIQGTIRVLNYWDGRPLSEDEFTEVICHELGHLLGLADVRREGVLMGPAVNGNAITEPTLNEARILNETRDLLRSKLQAAQNLSARSSK